MNREYKEGYYEGWVACMRKIEKLTQHYLDQMGKHEELLLADGTLHGDAIISAHCDAEEDCERYAFDELQDWAYGKIPGDKPPAFPENIVEATASHSE